MMWLAGRDRDKQTSETVQVDGVAMSDADMPVALPSMMPVTHALPLRFAPPVRSVDPLCVAHCSSSLKSTHR